MRRKAKRSKKNLCKERDKHTFCKIAQALGKQKQGLTELMVPDVKGRKTTLYTKEAINEVLLKQNQGHFQQANDTPFGSQGSGAPMVDPDNDKNIVEEILNGNFEPWPGMLPESKQWVNELTFKTSSIVDMEIMDKDFVNHFKNMRESKSSSPSGWHIGHYITTTKSKNSDIHDVYIKIAYIAMITATPLPCWLMCTQIMLEKGKGPFIEDL